jgi:phosphoglycerate dehydrogenase-like enzyme
MDFACPMWRAGMPCHREKNDDQGSCSGRLAGRGAKQYRLVAAPLKARAEVVFFEQAFDDENDAAAKLVDFDIVLSMRERTPLPDSLINRLSRLRMLGITGARNLSLDTPACTARGVVVCNTVGGAASEAAPAELALALLLAAARAIPIGDANIRAGGVQMGVPVGIGLAGKTIGIVGLGRLGSHMAATAGR